MKTIIKFTIVAALAAIVLGAAVRSDAAPPASETPSGHKGAEQADKTATFAIKGMRTDSCPVLVRSAVERENGVVSVSADRKTKSATVRYKPADTSASKILDVIKSKTGFKAEIVKVE